MMYRDRLVFREPNVSLIIKNLNLDDEGDYHLNLNIEFHNKTGKVIKEERTVRVTVDGEFFISWQFFRSLWTPNLPTFLVIPQSLCPTQSLRRAHHMQLLRTRRMWPGLVLLREEQGLCFGGWKTTCLSVPLTDTTSPKTTLHYSSVLWGKRTRELTAVWPATLSVRFSRARPWNSLSTVSRYIHLSPRVLSCTKLFFFLLILTRAGLRSISVTR